MRKRGVSLALAMVLVTSLVGVASAQDVEGKSVTVKVTLTAEQVAALKAYRELRTLRGPDGLVYGASFTIGGAAIPPSTPDYDVVPKVKPVLGFNAWVEEKLAAHLNSMIEEVERQNGEELAAEVRALTPEQKRAVRAQLNSLKEKK